jgi:hypothetical protein
MQEKSTPTSTMTSEPEAAALAIIRLGSAFATGSCPGGSDHLCVRMELSDSKRAAILGLTSTSLLGIKSE